MSFVAVKLLKLGYSQAKKHKAKKQQQQQQQQQQQPGYPVQYPEPYPMTEYPPGMAPGANVHYPPPALALAPAPAPAPAPAAEQTSKSAKLVSMFISALRFLQFVFGLTAIGLYGKDVQHDHDTQNTWHAKWVFALITAFLATVTAVVHLIVPFCMRRVNHAPNPALKLPQFAWEFVLCVLWLTLFGVFGRMYIGVYPASDSGSGKKDSSSSSDSSATAGLGDASKIDRMRHAVWVDLANLALWVFTASWVLLRWLKGRRAAAATVDAEKGEGA